MNPTVSVIIPCYNQAHFLPEAVQSVVNQIFTDWECIIVNDGSPDNTREIAEQIIEQYKGKRIKLLNQKNQGLAMSRNNGIAISQGKYILPLDADDIINPVMLEKAVSLLEEHAGIAIAYTDQIYFGAVNKTVHCLEYDFGCLLKANYFAYSSLYRRHIWEEVKGYNTNMVWGYEDWDFWISCGENGYFGKRIPEPLFMYRVKEGSMLTKALEHDAELKSQIVLNHPNLYSQSDIAKASEILVKQAPYNPRKELTSVAPSRGTRAFKVIALISAHNEGDVIYHVIGDLIKQGVEVYFINHCSTDNTVEEASKWLGKGLAHIENFPQDANYPKENRQEYIWSHILKRKQELAATLDADWFIHHDADEFRESPWPGLSLFEAIYIVDRSGYNAINFALLNFRPIDDNFIPGTDVREAMKYFEWTEEFNKRQIKAWKKQKKPVDLVFDGGHDIQFEMRKVYPIKFILRHYPIRSQLHGVQKVFQERKQRFNAQERNWGWHIQYNNIKNEQYNFLYNPSNLKLYDGNEIRLLILSEQACELKKQLLEESENTPNLLSSPFGNTQHLEKELGSRLRVEQDNTCAVSSVSIIIPVFNKVKLTEQCLIALRNNTQSELYSSCEVIMIDNGSTDTTKEFLKGVEGRIHVITNSENRGFAKACNQGAEKASSDYLLFLNNDTEPEKGWLEPLLEVLDKDPSVGAVGSKLLFPDGTLQHAGVVIFNDRKLPDPLVARHIYYGQTKGLPEANQLREYQALTAACLIIRKSAFNEVGGFDEGYWNGYEDVDLCFKLQEKGWKLVYQPESVVIHHESKSGPERFSKVSENIQRLHNKWIGKIKPDIIIKEDGSTIVAENSKIQRYSLPHTNFIKTFDSGQLKTVSIVILTWNVLEYTKKCVHSIQNHTSYPHEIIFVDNASTDGTLEYLRNLVKEHSNYKLIENKENRGFAAGNNQGVAAASGDYVLLLNNDVLVSDGWLESLIESLEKDEKIGMVGPITNSISGRQMVSSIPYTDDGGFHEFSQKIRKAYYGRLTPRYRIAGFAVLMKKSLYEDVGGLDESFGTGNYEDDDLCLKIREKGYAVMVDESVFIHHYRSQTFIENKIDYRSSLSVNESKFMKKWPDVDYKSLLELDKGLVDINADLISQGQKAIESENADEAIKVYTKVLSTNPIDEAALCGIGMAYQMIGKTDGAIDAYKKVIKKYTYFSRQLPSGGNSYLLDAYHNLALIYAGANQIDDAIFMLKKAIALNGRDASLHNNLGVLYFKKKMHTEAAQCFSDALSIDAHYGEAKKNLEKVSRLKNS